MLISTPTHSPRGDFQDENLIFLVSQPRAGSTLLQSILAGLEDVHTTAEPWLMLHPLYALRETGHTADYDAVVASRALSDFLSTLNDGEAQYLAAVRSMSLELYNSACRQAGKLMFLDKTPRYYKVLPELWRVFPRAHFIILLRNPAAVLASILHTWVKGDWTRFDYFRDDLLNAPVMLTDFLAKAGAQAIVVHYESLILSPAETIRDVCHRLNQPYASQLLHYGERVAPSGRYGDPSGVGQHDQPSAESLNLWLEEARDPQIHHLLMAYLEAIGPDVIARLGYDSRILLAALKAVMPNRGRPSVTWQQLLESDKSFGDKLWLIFQEARHEKRPRHTAKQIGRLMSNRL